MRLEKAEYFREQRERCARYYYNALKGFPGIELPKCVVLWGHHSWHLFPIIVLPESPLSRNVFMEGMAKTGIGTSVHYKPLHKMSYYKQKYNLQTHDFPNSEKIWKGTVSLPIYPDLDEYRLEYICETINILLKR